MHDAFVEQLWRFALAAIPMALLVALVCRLLPCRPCTRHLLWLATLLLIIVAPLLPPAPAPDLMAAIKPDSTSANNAAVRSEISPVIDDDNAIWTAIARAQSTDTPHRSSPVEHIDRSVAPRVKADRPSTSGGPTSAPSRSRLADQPLPARIVDSNPVESAAPVTDSAPPRLRSDSTSTLESIPSIASSSAQIDRCVDETPEAASWRAWGLWLRDLRDSVLAIPPLPAIFWGGGAAVILLVLGVRIVHFQRLLRRSTPAPPTVALMVRDASKRFDLARIPSTRMIEAPASPMVWCGVKPVLLIPWKLWNELDDIGRSAVIHHELAHLRRRDHWVCWISLIAGCLYWWHPLMWWIRRQIREEADLCCDAWVTALMPDARRAYASALLQARQCAGSPCANFSHSTAGLPGIGLGVPTSRTKRFARRITMVMSHQTAPRLTVAGILLCCCVVAAGWLVTPTIACPPEKDADYKKQVDKEKQKAKQATVRFFNAPAAPTPPHAPKPPHAAHPTAPPHAPAPNESTFEQFMRDRGHDDDASLDERIERIEKQIEELMQRLQKWGQNVESDMPRLQRQMTLEAGRIAEGAARQAQGAYEKALTFMNRADDIASATTRASAEPPCDEPVYRSYKLPQGKLELLTELMTRSDVPILVRPGGDSIEVQATPDQHRTFRAFCLMINGDDQKTTYELPQGKLEALTQLMLRADVPILVSPKKGGIEVNGTTLEQSVFESFVDLIHPRNSQTANAPRTGVTRTIIGQAAQLPSRIQQSRAADIQAELLRSRKVEAEMRLHNQRNRAEVLRKQAEELQRHAEQLRKEAEDLEGALDNADDAEREELLWRQSMLMSEAAMMFDRARAAEVEANASEEVTEVAETDAETIADAIQEVLEAKEKKAVDEARRIRSKPDNGVR